MYFVSLFRVFRGKIPLMNTKLNPIFARRSVRKFTAKPVSPEMIHDLLEAGMAAPSARACDPWSFIVIQKRETLDAMADIMPYGQMLRQAPLAIAVVGDQSKAAEGELSYMIQDCSAAAENILIAASLLGLGGVWLGAHPRPERMEPLIKTLNLPSHITPVALLAIGYPAETPEPRTRYRNNVVHKEHW